MLDDALSRTRGPMTFIVGSGRSGTTLLAAMLDAHPDLAIADESHFLPTLIARLPARLTTDEDVERMMAALGRSKWFGGWEYDVEALRTALVAALPISRPDALRMIYRVNAAAQGATRFGEKTPAYVYNMSLLASEIRDARFIHIVRDVRNVVLSFREASFGSDDLEHSALNWQRRVLDGHKTGSAFGRDRYIEVLYERLIANPERELRRPAEFLDLPFSTDMLAYYTRQDAWSPRGPASENVGRPPTETREWSGQLTPAEHARIEILAGRALETWGHELTATPSTADRLAATRARLRWWYYRMRSKTGLARRSRTETGWKGDRVSPTDSD